MNHVDIWNSVNSCYTYLSCINIALGMVLKVSIVILHG